MASHTEPYTRNRVVELRDVFDPCWRDLGARGIEYNPHLVGDVSISDE